MAKRKKTKISPSLIKLLFVLGLACFFGALITMSLSNFMTQSDYFKVKAVVIDSSLQFINKGDLTKLKGKSIFLVDANEVQKKLSFKYPEVADIKVIKRFPDQILVLAKKRHPLAQLRIKENTVTLDEKGVVLSDNDQSDGGLPQILGVHYRAKVQPGASLYNRNLLTALNIVYAFETNRILSNYKMRTINVENLSKIQLTLSNNLNIIVDKDKIDKKIGILSLMMSRGQLDLNDVKYIDLRFKEPILGK